MLVVSVAIIFLKKLGKLGRKCGSYIWETVSLYIWLYIHTFPHMSNVSLYLNFQPSLPNMQNYHKSIISRGFSLNCPEMLTARSQMWLMRSSRMWMRSSQDVDKIDLAEWLERLRANSEVATVPASSDTIESKVRQMNQCWVRYWKKFPQKSPFKGAVSWDRFQKFWQKFTELGLIEGRSWFLNFLGAPIILKHKKYIYCG